MKARRRNRQRYSDEKLVLSCLLVRLVGVNKANFFSLRLRDTLHIFHGTNLMYYLSPTWIISNELKLMSRKSFRTFHCFSGNAKFLPRAQLIRACFLAQQGWLCTCTLRASQTLSPQSPEELCLCEQTKALAFHDFQSPGSRFDPSSSALHRLAAGSVPRLPTLFIFSLPRGISVVQRYLS